MLLLLERQSTHEKFFETDSEKSNENLDRIVFSIGIEGWPSLECQFERDVLTVGTSKKAAGGD